MMFKAINSSCDGMVTQEKLAAVLANPAVTAYFQTLDIESWRVRVMALYRRQGCPRQWRPVPSA